MSKSPTHARVSLALAVSMFGAIAGAAYAQPSSPPAHTSSSAVQSYSFAFRDADLAQVADEILGQALGLNYTLDSAVTAKVSFRVSKRMTPTQLLDEFESVLAAEDIVLVRDGDNVLITTRSKAKTSNGARGQGAARAGYQVAAIELQGLTPSEASKALDTMGLSGLVVMSDDKTGQFLLGGTTKEIQSARDALKLISHSGAFSTHNRWVTVHNASPKTIAEEMTNVASDANLGGLRISPFPRLNQVLLFARSEADLDEAVRWINRLDVVTRNDTGAADESVSLWVYKPKHVTAVSLNITLNALLGDGSAATDDQPLSQLARPSSTTTTSPSTGSPTSGSTQQIGSAFQIGAQTPAAAPSQQTTPRSSPSSNVEGIRVAVDKESNSLVIYAPPARRAEIQQLLEAIDVPLRQVLIEASILEVTLTSELDAGVDWSVLGAGGKLNIISSGNQTGTIAPTFPGLGITYLTNNLKASIDALGSRSRVQVLSSPKIVTLDNGVAHLEIGDQVPVVTQTSQSTLVAGAPQLVSVDYRNTGVILDVTPRVTGGNSVTLSISQEVSSVAKTTTSGIDSPTIQQRQFDSTLLLDSGQTVALGGLISSSDTKQSTGIPFLSDVPGLGQLFRTDTHSKDRTELIVLLSVTILADPAGTSTATTKVTSEMQSIDSHGAIKP